MTTKQIFIQKLKNAGYGTPSSLSLSDDSFNAFLILIEKDRENVFHAMYGDKLIEDRGVKPIKEYIYRLMEAEKDLQMGYIKLTMHYLIMQIHTNALKL